MMFHHASTAISKSQVKHTSNTYFFLPTMPISDVLSCRRQICHRITLTVHKHENYQCKSSVYIVYSIKYYYGHLPISQFGRPSNIRPTFPARCAPRECPTSPSCSTLRPTYLSKNLINAATNFPTFGTYSLLVL